MRALAAVCIAVVASCRSAPAPPPKSVEPASKAASPSPHFGAEFWKTWGDGQAEMSAYDLTFPRYGQQRRGVAVAIFVTETFSNSARVKSDPGRHAPADEFPVMKLNLVKDFQTGVYDYNNMTSTFVSLADVNGLAAGSPSKISFSSQEWCGHVYAQALFNRGGVELTSHSYFDGEADQRRGFAYEAKLSGAEDALQFWARGMAEPFVDTAGIPVLGSLETARLLHRPLVWREASFTRAPATERVTVPAGAFETRRATVRATGGSEFRYWVETAAPHRVIKWETSDGEKAEMLGSDRMKYWQMNGEGGEEALRRIGLTRRGLRMP